MTGVKAANRENMSPEAEKDCMARIANGDRVAFGDLIDLYMTDIYRFSYSILGDPVRAEDITQETCLKLWTRAGQWTPTGRVKSWLFRIAHNLCMDELRGQKPQVEIDKLAFTLRDPQQDQASAYSDREVAKVVNEALFTLPERQRTALVLVHYNGYSNIEAAKIMAISVDAIESLLARGRRTLKNVLSGSRQSLLEG